LQGIDTSIAAGVGLESAARIAMPSADGQKLSVCLLRFDAERFSSSAFGEIGINCPDSIVRSVRKRQAEFFFGRLASRLVLGELSPELAALDIPIGASREPLWPGGVIGSISHCQGYAASTAQLRGRRRGIGIDIEQVVNADMQQALLASVVQPQEMDYLRTVRELPLPVLLTLVFSAKEAFFKATFAAVGRMFGFDALRVPKIDLRQGRLHVIQNHALSECLVEGQPNIMGFGFVAPGTLLTHCVW